MDACPYCNGALHVRIPGTEVFRRCVCLRKVLSREFIRPLIRGNDPEPPPTTPVLPLTDFVMTGPIFPFRQMVWHSLLQYEPDGIVYEYLSTHRLPLIHFQQDEAYPSILPLQEMRLLILVGGAEIKNSFLGPLTLQTLQVRQQAGLPTWVHMESFAHVHTAYGPELVQLLRTMGGAPATDPSPTTLTDAAAANTRSAQSVATGM